MKQSYWTTWTASLLFFATFYTLLVPLPLYLTGAGLPDWQIGVILGAFGVASLVGRPLAGVLTDAWGRRWVMLAGTGALVVGAVGVTATTDPVPLFALRILQAAGYVAFTTAATALISDLAPAERRGASLALFGVAANVAMTLTPAAVDAALPTLGLKGALWLSGALAALGGSLALIVRFESTVEKRRPAWREAVRVPAELRLPMLAAGLFGVGFGAFLQFLPLLVQRRALEPAGLAYTVYGVGIILTRLATGRALDRGNRRLLLSLAFLAMSGGLAGFAFVQSREALLASVLLVAAGSGILHPALIAIHIERMSSGERGRATAGFYLGFDLGIGAGTWALTPVFQWFSVTGLYLLAALVTVGGVLMVRPMIWQEVERRTGMATAAQPSPHST
jgi:MFS family permease